jgi:anthranilate phosphoribosyltransferase
MTAALALVAVGASADKEAAARRAEKALDDGSAARTLATWATISQG